MSEKTLTELVETRLEIDAWRAYRHEQRPWIAMFDARIRRAEAAEAYAAWVVDVPPQATTLDIYATGERLLREYVAAREAVCKMEAGLPNDDNS
jgi:hypothetical protein